MFEVHSLSSAMVRIQRQVARGLWFHTNGIIGLEKAERVLTKLNELYGLTESSSAERRRQRHGRACVRVTIWNDARGVAFVINASDGAGLIHERETLLDCRDSENRIKIRDYELVRLPRRGGGVKWTWRMDLDQYRRIVDEAQHLARRENQSAAQAVIDGLLRRPGFNGIRTQRAEIIRVMQSEARRAGRRPLVVPAVIPWIRACYNNCEPFETWLRTEQVRRALSHVTEEV